MSVGNYIIAICEMKFAILFPKYLLTILFMFVLVNMTSAQSRTYYYKQESYYDTVERKKFGSSGHCEFYTFTQSEAYVSDENGNKIGKVPYSYRGRTEDGNLWYCQTFLGKWEDQFSIVVSSDYSILNCRVGSHVFVYERSTPPAKKPADPHLLK